MDLKKRIRDLAALTRKSNAGFTLVELMVVIAIMAILGGASVAGYSTYVKKTNMQADRTLAAEIARALQTHYYTSYDGTDTSQGGYVVLNYGEDAVPGGYAAEALEATYGDNWAQMAQLKYDGWEFNKDAFNALTNPYASSIPDSSYISKVGTEKLLGDVQNCTTTFAKFLSGLSDNSWLSIDGAKALNGLLTGDDTKTPDVMADYEGEVTADVLANATVFGVASTLKDKDNAKNTVDKFSDGYYLNRFDTTHDEYAPVASSPTVLTDVAHTYAALEAFVGYSGQQEVVEEFEKLNTNLQQAATVTDVLNLLNTAGEEIIFLDMIGNNCRSEYIENGSSATDGEAYVAMMQTVNGLENDYKDSLNTGDLFSSEDVLNRVNSFVGAVGSGSGMDLSNFPEALQDDIEINSVVVAVDVDENGTPVYSVLFCNN